MDQAAAAAVQHQFFRSPMAARIPAATVEMASVLPAAAFLAEAAAPLHRLWALEEMAELAFLACPRKRPLAVAAADGAAQAILGRFPRRVALDIALWAGALAARRERPTAAERLAARAWAADCTTSLRNRCYGP